MCLWKIEYANVRQTPAVRRMKTWVGGIGPKACSLSDSSAMADSNLFNVAGHYEKQRGI